MNLKWGIVYSNQARLDLQEIGFYIRNNLNSPKSASKIINKIIDEIGTLNYMPYRYQKCFIKPWYKLGLRFLPVHHYLIFYYPNNENKVVEIIRILYNKEDIPSHLPKK